MTAHEFLAQALTSVTPLSKAALRQIVPAFVPRTLRADERLLIGGDVCDQLSFVSTGVLMSQSTWAQRESSCDLFTEGDFATDYVSFLTKAPSTVEIVALEPCSLLSISRPALERLYDAVPGVDRLGRKIAEWRFVASVHRAGSLLSDSPTERYLALCRDRPSLVQRVPQFVLARWLGVTPESLSRIRRRLAAQRSGTSTRAVVPSKSKAPAEKSGGPRAPRASREKP
jgi:CRP/FNR family transcriptional regulator, anaerobic regulatory protein